MPSHLDNLAEYRIWGLNFFPFAVRDWVRCVQPPVAAVAEWPVGAYAVRLLARGSDLPEACCAVCSSFRLRAALFLPSAVFSPQSVFLSHTASPLLLLSSGAALTQMSALPRPPSRCWVFFHVLSGLPSPAPFRRALLLAAALCACPSRHILDCFISSVTVSYLVLPLDSFVTFLVLISFS